MTASDLQTALRAEANTAATTSGVSNVRFTLFFKNGTNKTYKLNPNGSWRFKPTTDERGWLRFEWLDTSESHIIADDGETITVADNVYTETIDAGEVIGYEFLFDVATTKTRDIPSNN